MMRVEENMTVTEQQSEPGGRDRPLIIGGAVILAVVLLAVIAIAMGGRTVTLDADSPEGVVQRYTQAVIDGDLSTAEDLLVDSRECERFEDPYIDGDLRVTLGDVSRSPSATAAAIRSLRTTTPIARGFCFIKSTVHG
jgi:hypothetical protein